MPTSRALADQKNKCLNVATEARSVRIQNTCAFRVKRRSDQCVQCWKHPKRNTSDQSFYLQFKFTPKIGHTFTDEREVVVEVPKRLVRRKSESINESLKEVIALSLAKGAALGTFPTEAERDVDLYNEDPPIWYHDRLPVMNERPCDHEENGTRAWRVA